MRELNLGWNEFGDAGAMHLATCVHKIETLDVRECNITARGSEALAQRIREMNHQVKILNNVKLIRFLNDKLRLHKNHKNMD